MVWREACLIQASTELAFSHRFVSDLISFLAKKVVRPGFLALHKLTVCAETNPYAVISIDLPDHVIYRH